MDGNKVEVWVLRDEGGLQGLDMLPYLHEGRVCHRGGLLSSQDAPKQLSTEGTSTLS
jgi:hypothetical protein